MGFCGCCNSVNIVALLQNDAVFICIQLCLWIDSYEVTYVLWFHLWSTHNSVYVFFGGGGGVHVCSCRCWIVSHWYGNVLLPSFQSNRHLILMYVLLQSFICKYGLSYFIIKIKPDYIHCVALFFIVWSVPYVRKYSSCNGSIITIKPASTRIQVHF